MEEIHACDELDEKLEPGNSSAAKVNWTDQRNNGDSE